MGLLKGNRIINSFGGSLLLHGILIAAVAMAGGIAPVIRSIKPTIIAVDLSQLAAGQAGSGLKAKRPAMKEKKSHSEQNSRETKRQAVAGPSHRPVSEKEPEQHEQSITSVSSLRTSSLEQPLSSSASTETTLSADHQLKSQPADANPDNGGAPRAGVKTISSGYDGTGKAIYFIGDLPVYPPRARRAGWEGAVSLSVKLRSDGRPESVKVEKSSGYTILDDTAVAAVKKWCFVEGKTGNPITGQHRFPFLFRLNDAG